MKNLDLFGNEIIEPNSLKRKYLIPPFSIFDTASGDWQNRKNKWKSLGIESEVGRQNKNSYQRMTGSRQLINLKSNKTTTKNPYVSIFDPVLCEIIYNWFVIPNGTILDPFAGGSVRGIVANYLDYQYTGIDLKEEQILSNQNQALRIIPDNIPEWIIGDSYTELDKFDKTFDFIFSCPPYYNLEVYSNNIKDLSNMDYLNFYIAYKAIILKCCKLLKDNRFACFVVGNIRDKDGFIIDLVGITITLFEQCGLRFYNEIILKNQATTAALRADNNMTYKKVVKIHQNVLVFCKGNPKFID
jgi:DNA modification methylase|tara:strand:- start:492 stop:1391 length:900 start_codon:yes stop_codon:yes gene_type:complete